MGKVEKKTVLLGEGAQLFFHQVTSRIAGQMALSRDSIVKLLLLPQDKHSKSFTCEIDGVEVQANQRLISVSGQVSLTAVTTVKAAFTLVSENCIQL